MLAAPLEGESSATKLHASCGESGYSRIERHKDGTFLFRSKCKYDIELAVAIHTNSRHKRPMSIVSYTNNNLGTQQEDTKCTMDMFGV